MKLQSKTTNVKEEFEIGIGVTEHNRPEVFKEFLKNIKKYMPPNAKLVIVDDASDEPVPNADFRFDQNVGIATAKNKCLELLRDCKHIFLFDSDCWPKTKDWYKPYIQSKEPHLCYIFKDFVNAKLHDSAELYRDSKLVAYSHPRGCMLYFDNKCLEAVGGMDTNYKRWGYEHVDISNRIFNVGLTLFRYQDVPNSNKLIYSADEHQAVKSTVSLEERRPYIKEMYDYFQKSFNSTNFCPFIEGPNESTGYENVVVTVYFTGVTDPQRPGIKWEADIEQCRTLIDSMNGQKLVILHDCFDEKTEVPDNVELVRVETAINPYFQRWVSIYQYLRDHEEIAKVFCVDATDVEMLRNPFKFIEHSKLYLGSEHSYTLNNWMLTQHRVPFLVNFMKKYARYTLLNPGVIGGTRTEVMALLRRMNQVYFDEKGVAGNTDMALYNFVARTYFRNQIITGPQVHTKFKAFERNNQIAWWRHK